MEKMKQSIQNAMAKLNISQSELSKRIGYSRGYLGEMQRIGCSTTKQEQIAQLCDSVANGEVFKTDAQVIAELSEKLAEQQEESSVLRGELKQAIKAIKEIKSLEITQKNILLVKNEIVSDLHRHRFVLFVGLVLSIIIGVYGWVK